MLDNDQIAISQKSKSMIVHNCIREWSNDHQYNIHERGHRVGYSLATLRVG